MPQEPPEPYAQTLLARAFSPTTAEVHYNDRILKRQLPLHVTSPTPSARALRRQTLNTRKERARKSSMLKPRPLSAAKKRALGLHEIPPEQQKYAIYEGLHGLWVGYVRDVLGLTAGREGEGRAHVTPTGAGQLLASIDLHGAVVEVVRSRCVSRVGLKGIVVRDTKFTFEIITEKNVVKSVPKEHTVFRFEVPLPEKEEEGGEVRKPLVFDIVGEQFQTKGADRANKKFRMHYRPDI